MQRRPSSVACCRHSRNMQRPLVRPCRPPGRARRRGESKPHHSSHAVRGTAPRPPRTPECGAYRPHQLVDAGGAAPSLSSVGQAARVGVEGDADTDHEFGDADRGVGAAIAGASGGQGAKVPPGAADRPSAPKRPPQYSVQAPAARALACRHRAFAGAHAAPRLVVGAARQDAGRRVASRAPASTAPSTNATTTATAGGALLPTGAPCVPAAGGQQRGAKRRGAAWGFQWGGRGGRGTPITRGSATVATSRPRSRAGRSPGPGALSRSRRVGFSVPSQRSCISRRRSAFLARRADAGISGIWRGTRNAARDAEGRRDMHRTSGTDTSDATTT
jgi:hypothetical protein